MVARQLVACSVVLLVIFVHYIPTVSGTAGGTLFALAFTNLSSLSTTSPVLEEIHISSFNKQTLVKIIVPQLHNTTVISLDSSNSFRVSLRFPLDITTPKVDFNYPLAVIVASLNESINVQVSKSINDHSAGYLAMPIQRRTSPVYQYYVPSYTCQQSTLTIVAVENDTCISVEDYNYNGHSDGIDFIKLKDATMQQGEVINLYSSGSDYTGLFVSARKPISVFGGCVCAQVSNTTPECDHIFEQVPEVMSLLPKNYRALVEPGPKFILTSIPGRPSNNDFSSFNFRVISAPNGFVVTVRNVTEYRYQVSGTLIGSPINLLDNQKGLAAPFTLYKGQWLEFTAGQQNNPNEFSVVVVDCSDDTCLVTQYNPGSGIRSTPDGSDPYMLVIPPVSLYTSDITFSTSKVNGDATKTVNNFLTVISHNSVRQDLRVDGNPVAHWIAVGLPYSSLVDFSVGYMQVSDGYHTLTTTTHQTGTLYTAYVIGHGTDPSMPTAYGYLAGYDNWYIDGRTNITCEIPGPWCDLSPQQTGPTTAPAPDTGITSAPPAAPAPEDLPIYSLVWIAEFTALNPSYGGKTPDWECSNAYFTYFQKRINELETYLTSGSDPDVVAACPINVYITIRRPLTRDSYYSEYSLSKGRFTVLIQGNGTATLGDVNGCASLIQLKIYDPNEWISDFQNDQITRFLRNDDASFQNLSQCATMYLSNPNKRLTRSASGWVCPTSTGAVYGAVARLNPSLLATYVTIVVSIVLGTQFVRRRSP